jgi:hypothetical protein
LQGYGLAELEEATMPYEGELLDFCPADLDFTLTQAVVVSGASWNPCGHMILCAGTSSANSWYFTSPDTEWGLQSLGFVKPLVGDPGKRIGVLITKNGAQLAFVWFAW